MVLTAAQSAPVLAEAPLVLSNARIYTVDETRPWAEAVAIDEEGVILAVGSAREVLAEAGSDAAVIDLAGRMLLPGFQDAHLHAVEAGITATYCPMPQFGSEAMFEAALEDCALEQGERPWVMGAGVNMIGLLEAVADPLALIDAVIPDRPAIVIDDLGHGAWANSPALRAAGIDRLEEDPPGGIVMRLDDGRLSGVVLESLGQTLIDAAQPPSQANLDFAYDSLMGALEILAENGITTVSDAGGYWPRGHERVWEMAEARGRLSVRASNALYLYPEKEPEAQVAALIARFSNDPDRLLRFNQVKIYVDGILSQATGALYEPYEEGLGLAPEERLGFEYFARDQLFGYARALTEAGFQLHFHITGDRGAGLALDAIAQSSLESGPHRITHLYLVDPRDRPRFAELGVVADFQIAPSSVAPDYLDGMAEIIGARVDRLLPLRSMVDTGALVTLSSDWDADEISPLVKLETVLTRETEAAPDLASAIEMMTINPARLLQQAERTGSIEPGKFADLVVLDRDLFTLDPAAISSARVVATLLQGEPVFDPEKLFAN